MLSNSIFFFIQVFGLCTKWLSNNLQFIFKKLASYNTGWEFQKPLFPKKEIEKKKILKIKTPIRLLSVSHSAKQFILVLISYLGLSILQNGDIPKFISEYGLNQIFTELSPESGYLELQRGLKDIGIHQVIK